MNSTKVAGLLHQAADALAGVSREVVAGPYENIAREVQRVARSRGVDLADMAVVKPLVEEVYRDRTGLLIKPDELDKLIKLVMPRAQGPWVQHYGHQYDVPDEVLDLVKSGVLTDWSGLMTHFKRPAFGRDVLLGKPGIADVPVVVLVDHPDRNRRIGPRASRFTIMVDWMPVFKTDEPGEAALAIRAEIKKAQRP